MPFLNNGVDAKSREDASMPIAIVGIGFRGPGDATNTEKLWKLVAEGRESRTSIPKERWNHEAFYHPDPNRYGTYNIEAGHFMQGDLSRFDAPFFNLTAAEAAALDPQQRFLLECSYEAVENAGLPLGDFQGSSTSVFVGSFCTDYTDMLWRDPESVPMYQCTNAGHSRANMANRLSYFYDLKGPSVTIDTACSTSLVALHLGCQSLRTGDARRALVAGASAILSHEVMVTMSMMRFMSPDGRCYTFDERASGYARGEGVGCLLLEPLEDAIREGHSIRAVIRGTGSNQDGKTPGITMPSGTAQEALIRSVYSSAGLDPLETGYVEAHGTGTQAGDPIETGALSRVFCPDRSPDNPLRIGSVKTNIGHLEGASGVAGLIKTILMLENKSYLPNRNFKTPNPRIPLEEWKLKVPTILSPWPGPGPRRASVNSFGYGGANAHAILENAQDYLSSHGLRGFFRSFKSLSPPTQMATTKGDSTASIVDTQNGHGDESIIRPTTGSITGPKRLFLLSCFDEVVGKDLVESLKAYVDERRDSSDKFLRDLAYTLNERRTKFVWKAAVNANTTSDLSSVLNNSLKFHKTAKQPKIGFVFTGQGAQWPQMGKELLSTYPVYQKSLERSAMYLKNAGAEFDVIHELIKDSKDSQINLALYSQPLCSAIQIALVDLLASWGIKPQSVVGHSSGEIAAAYAMGALNHEDAMLVAYHRGVCSSRMASKELNGSMMAVGMSEESVQPLIESLTLGKAVVACVNSPSSITISGDVSAIDELHIILEDKKIFARKLAVEVAYHSHHMNAISEEYRAALENIKTRDPETNVDFFSSVTGEKASASDLGAEYWVNNMLGQVRFARSTRQLCLETSGKMRRGTGRRGVDILVEIGPHSALAGPIRQILEGEEKLSGSQVAYLSALTRKADPVDCVLNLASSLVTKGYPVDLTSVNSHPGDENCSLLVDLPPYPWNHSNSYWAESRLSRTYRTRTFPRTDLLGALERNSSPLEPRWRNIIRLSETPWLRDHKIQGNIVYPAAGYIAMAIEAAYQRAFQRTVAVITGYKLREVSIGSALVIPESPGEVEVFITLKSYTDSVRAPSAPWDEFIVSSVSDGDRWTEHCRGLILIQTPQKAVNVIDGEVLESSERSSHRAFVEKADASCRHQVDITKFYQQLTDLGLEYGNTFANMTEARSATNSCIGHIKIPDTKAVMPMNVESSLLVHPATLDGLFHTIFVALSGNKDLEDPAVPVSVEEIYVSSNVTNTPNRELIVCTSTEWKDHRYLSASMDVFERLDASQPVISIIDITCAKLDRQGTQEDSDEPGYSTYNMKWQADVDLLSAEAVKTLCSNVSLPAKGVTSELFPTVAKDNLEKLVEQLSSLPVLKSLARYIQLHGHKNPFQTIMAIGACSGLVSIAVSTILAEEMGKTPCFTKVEYTDTSFDLSNVLNEKLPAWSDLIKGRELDIQANPVDQGFSTQSYDLVIAFNLQQSTESLNATLTGVQKLLKSGSRLVLVDLISDSLAKPMIMNILPSNYSLTESTQLLTSKSWAQHLENTGFTLDTIIADESENSGLFLVASKPRRLADTMPDVLLISEGPEGNAAAKLLQSLLSSRQIRCTITSFDNAMPSPAHVCVVLGALDKKLLAAPTSEEFEATKRIYLQSGGVLWVTRGATVASVDPTGNLIVGFARTIRSEASGAPLVTLDLDADDQLADEATADVIFSLYKLHFAKSRDSSNEAEHEYAERKGLLLIPRIVEDVEFTKFLTTDRRKPELQPYHQQNRPLQMKVGSPGLLDTIYFTDDDRVAGKLPDDHVDIDVKATGLNFKDVMMGLGQIKVESLGWECSGVIRAIGKDVTNLSIGDRVTCYGLGTFCTQYRGPAACIHRIPDSMSFEEAAALPVTYATAYYSVHHLARVQKGETTLVHAATGGLGQAIIELCQLIGAEIYATVGTLEKKAFLMDHFKIPEDHIFFSRDGSFQKGVMRMTGGKGVDVVMNSLAGEGLRLTWECIAPYGRFIELGARDITINSRLEMGKFIINPMFASFNLVFLFEQKPHVANKVLADVMDLFWKGSLKGPSPLHVYPISQVEKALRTMQTGSHMGKLVATSNPGDVVMVMPEDTSKNMFRPDVSYLLVGGLGGIGRATALWMTDSGVQNIIFANRSGMKSQEAKALIDTLKERGCKATVYSCDVSKAEDVDSLVVQSAKDMPPIKGVIQGAMVLRDTLLDKMSLEDYTSVVKPKVQGTWNLHNLLPKDMDFFVMLSSVSGVVGNATQAAYAAGNTFLDAFAAYRIGQGLPATTIDLGVILGVGYLADNTELARAMERQGFEGTREQTLMRLLQFAIENPRRPIGLSQAITGLGTWKGEESLESLSLPPFSHFRRRALVGLNNDANASKFQLRDMLRKVKSIEEASDYILAALVDKIALRTSTSVENISPSKPMSDYGIDSLVAVEMRNFISKEMDSTVPILELLANVPLTQLATKIASRSRLVSIETKE